MRWHSLLRAASAAAALAVLALGLFQDVAVLPAVLAVVPPLAAAAVAGHLGTDRLRALLVALALGWSAWLVVLWTGGAGEAHLAVLLAIVAAGLYTDVVPVTVVAALSAAVHLVLGLTAAERLHERLLADSAPLTTAVHLLAVAGAWAVATLHRRSTADREGEIEARAVSRALKGAEADRDQALAGVYATVARRNQAMLERQLAVIEELELREKDPEVLEQLFRLDHLATRMTRQAASMLVMAGGEPSKRVAGDVPATEVVRGAIGEIEDYTRVDLRMTVDPLVKGRAVGSLVHVLAELLENATAYSPPESRVVVTGSLDAEQALVLAIEDRGIGLDDASLEAFNAKLASPQLGTPTDSQRIGLDVVARLAHRQGYTVTLEHNAGAPGVTARVVVPAHLVDARELVSAHAPPAAATRTLPVDVDVPPVPIPEEPAAATPFAPEEPFVEEPEVVPDPTPPVAAPPLPQQSAGWSYAGLLERDAGPQPPAEPSRPGRGSRRRIGGRLDDTRSAAAGPPPAAAPPAAAPAQPASPPPARPTPRPRVDRPAPPVTARPPAASTGAPPAPAQPAATPPAQPAATPPARPATPPAAATPPAVTRPPATPRPAPEEPTAPAAPSRPSRPTPATPATPPAGQGTARIPRRSQRPAAAASSGPAASTDPGTPDPRPERPAAGVPSELPKRRRGASLPDALRKPEAEPTAARAAAAPVTREQSRTLLSSYQSRLQAGRRAAEEQVAQQGPAATPPAAPPPADEPSEPTSPQE